MSQKAFPPDAVKYPEPSECWLIAVVIVEARDTPASTALEPLIKLNCSYGIEDQYTTLVVEPIIVQRLVIKLAVL